jgi:hypothetical protein
MDVEVVTRKDLNWKMLEDGANTATQFLCGPRGIFAVIDDQKLSINPIGLSARLGLKVGKLGKTKRSGVTAHGFNDSWWYLRLAQHLDALGDCALTIVRDLCEVVRKKLHRRWAHGVELSGTTIGFDRWHVAHFRHP